MISKYLIPLLAVSLLAFAIYQMDGSAKGVAEGEPPIAPARSPYSRTVAGAGIVEPLTENITVGAAIPGVVTEVQVKEGDTVSIGALLFRLDDRHLQAELMVRKANLEAAEAQLARQQAMPRKEEVPVSEARVREAKANLARAEDLLRRAEALTIGREISEEEVVSRRENARAAREQLARAEAELTLLKAGAWEADKLVAQSAVSQARAMVAQTETEIKRLEVRALVAGEVLQVNVRPGEYVGTPAGQTLLVLGNVQQLHVRVDIDEHDIPRFNKGAPARATLRGDPSQKFDLRFVRVQPFVIPKRSLTGDNTERVDTRVLQAIYAVVKPNAPLYVGQQVDVFIEAPAGTTGN